MGEPGTFRVDLDELDALVGEMARCESALESLLADLARDVALLHETWTGLAAQAQRAAHTEWERGMRTMHRALGEVRSAAGTAHANYTSAAETNVAMWRRLR